MKITRQEGIFEMKFLFVPWRDFQNENRVCSLREF